MESGITRTVDIVKNKFVWVISPSPPQQKESRLCFNTERLNSKITTGISVEDLKQFLKFISELLNHHNSIVYYSKNNKDNILIGAFIVCFYRIVVLNQSSQTAYKFVADLKLDISQFGSQNMILYSLKTALFCLSKIKQTGLFDIKLSLESEIITEQALIHQIIPKRFFVFQYNKPQINTDNKQRLKNLSQFCSTMKKLNVTNIIGFEGEFQFPYDHQQFSLNGVKHNMITVYNSNEPDISFVDKAISFIKPEAIYAFNSQDQYGLSMLFIAAYCIKVFKFSLQQSVCWCRMMIPNSIKQSQLIWLKSKYKTLAGKEIFTEMDQIFKNDNMTKRGGIILTTDTRL